VILPWFVVRAEGVGIRGWWNLVCGKVVSVRDDEGGWLVDWW